MTEKGLLRLSKADLCNWRKNWLGKVWGPIFLAERKRKELVAIIVGEIWAKKVVTNIFGEERRHRLEEPKFYRYEPGRGHISTDG